MAKGQWSQTSLCTRIIWEALKMQTPRPSPDCCIGMAGPGESVVSGPQLSLLQLLRGPLILPGRGAANRDPGARWRLVWQPCALQPAVPADRPETRVPPVQVAEQ